MASGTTDCAPVALIGYNRPDHFARTLESLAACPEAPATPVRVFIDGPRTESDRAKADRIRATCARMQGRFLTFQTISRETNIGLARNVTEAVSQVCADFGRAIVLEDDIEVSPAFLRYMNDALDHYSDEKSVWHISAYTIVNDPARPDAFFFWRLMNCWGWATWQDRWQHFEKDAAGLLDTFSRRDIRRMNLDGAEDFWEQVKANHAGLIDTWAIFWYATIFKNAGLCLTPVHCYARNIGFDGSGVHSWDDGGANAGQPLNATGILVPPERIEEDAAEFGRIRDFYLAKRPPLLKRMRRRVKRSIKNLIRKAVRK
ncbi:MAG: glycosyltransferase [Rhizobiaceae bacterium]|nr:glycosyltransferase [Rhizobiaceae bacterium]